MTIRIREAKPADARGMARVHVDSWRSAYHGIMPADYLAGLSYDSRESWWEQVLTTERPVINLVAETGSGDIVGLAGTGPNARGIPPTGRNCMSSTCSRNTKGRAWVDASSRQSFTGCCGAGSTPCWSGYWRTTEGPAGSTNRWEAGRLAARRSPSAERTWWRSPTAGGI